ncbi:hypothetical protein HDU92_001970 [Lobulomyces angularis]|nr:hypothetical protein HDU92_001970 [Lobulomyces angularis]
MKFNVNEFIQKIQKIKINQKATSTKENLTLYENFIRPLFPNLTLPIKNSGSLVGYHLTIFKTPLMSNELSSDGYLPTFAPPSPPFKKRMWVGSNLTFHKDLKSDLQIYNKELFVENVKFKESEKKDILFVEEKRLISDEQGIAITDTRTIGYIHEKEKPVVSKTLKINYKPDFLHRLTPTPLILFRYSALTYNSHLIHYDSDYARNVENYPAILVHGPLTATLLLILLQNQLEGVKRIKTFNYKAVSPLFAGKEIVLNGRLNKKEENGTEIYDLWCNNEQGGLAMKGIATVS